MSEKEITEELYYEFLGVWQITTILRSDLFMKNLTAERKEVVQHWLLIFAFVDGTNIPILVLSVNF